ncbi:MAG: 4-hydroxythreonine-4-phosphate dehydrogenase PdxA [Pseudomonadota bacterium]
MDPARLPLLITMGDPVGIGPEIIVRAFQRGACEGCIVVGDASAMQRALHVVGRPMPVAQLDAPTDAAPSGHLPVWAPELADDDLGSLPWGRVDARAGRAAAACVSGAAQALMRGQGRAMVTAPLHKAALAAAGVPYPGHTEMLQALAGGVPVRMMLANEELRVVLVTIHLALRAAIEAVTYDAVLQTLRIANRSGEGLRIAVAGLNPHAGEEGLFGDEEQRFIAPAIAAAVAEGIDARGPFAPDTVFMRARRGEFDLVVAMTHDHGLIPVKYLGVEQGVNVTLGLPFVRTSPDHGTAFDIAGRGIADPSSLEAAIRWARRASEAGPGLSAAR